jgi:hypothetical protein
MAAPASSGGAHKSSSAEPRSSEYPTARRGHWAVGCALLRNCLLSNCRPGAGGFWMEQEVN